MKNIIGQPVLDVGAPAQVIWDERSLVLLKCAHAQRFCREIGTLLRMSVNFKEIRAIAA